MIPLQLIALDAPSADAHLAVMQKCRETLEQNSKTFALAARLLPPAARDRAAALYTYCRSVDDAIDDTPPAQQGRALSRLKDELEALYQGQQAPSAAHSALRAVIAKCALPQLYPQELLLGMEMDVANARYETLRELLLYCHRVASVVGLMMCHVLGVTRESALREAAQLGLAMQLTNICRDVAEDYQLGRLYLPRALLREAGLSEMPDTLHGPLPRDEQTRAAMGRVMKRLLEEAERYYDSAERGIRALPFRAGLAVRAASHLYRAIGHLVARRGYDPAQGRAVVSTGRKLAIVGKVLLLHLAATPLFLWERLRTRNVARIPRSTLRFPEQLL